MIKYYNVIGCKIAGITKNDALETVLQRIKERSGGYICFTNVHASVMAHENVDFMDVVNNSFLSLPDGKPVYWVGRASGLNDIDQIPGPDFFSLLLAKKNTPPLRHYFFGGKEETLIKLCEKVRRQYPDANIVGYESPPFRELSEIEISSCLERMRQASPDVIWIGLGAPKQELWMARHWESLRPAVLLGVGAAFSFHAGEISRAPLWARKLGMEWFHRLLQEPSRLWKRYFYTNSLFVFYLVKQIIRQR